MKITNRDVPPRAAWALEQGGLHPLLAKLVATGFSFVTVFTALRVFVFNAPAPERA